MNIKQSQVATYVIRRLPPSFMLWPNDLEWLHFCNKFHGKGKFTNESIITAFNEALKAENVPEMGMIDPFELLIDAGICDTHVKPL